MSQGSGNTDAHSGFTHNLDTNFQWVDNVSWTKGSHFLKLQHRRDPGPAQRLFQHRLHNNVNGTLKLHGRLPANTPYADFTARHSANHQRRLSSSVSFISGRRIIRSTRRTNSKSPNASLLNYGLRYELDGPYYDKNGATYTFDPLAILSIVVSPKGLVASSIPPSRRKQSPSSPPSRRTARQHADEMPEDEFLSASQRGVSTHGRHGKAALRAGYGDYGSTVYRIGLSKRRAVCGNPDVHELDYRAGVPALSFLIAFFHEGSAGIVHVCHRRQSESESAL